MSKDLWSYMADHGVHLLESELAELREEIDADTARLNCKYIYEVVDATNDEQYYTLGIFLTEADAMSVLDADEPPYNDDDPEAATIEVRRRPIGFHPHSWDKIAERTWVRNYDDTMPNWSAQPIRQNDQAQRPAQTTEDSQHANDQT